MEILIVLADLQNLIDETRTSQLRAFAEGTMENLLVQWVKYLLFCTRFRLPAIPASTVVLTWFVQFLTRTLKSHKSIVNYLSGVKTLHVLLEVLVEGFSGLILKLTLRGIRRLNTHVPRQALPMTPNILIQIKACLDFTDSNDCTFWSICLTAFFLLLRKSNLIPDTLSNYDASKLLCRNDLCWTSHCVVVTLRWAKTNQFHEIMTYPLPRIEGSQLCPYTALAQAIKKVPAARNSLCFLRADGKPFTYYQFHTKLRKCLALCGHDPSLYSSHSFRRGVCTFSFLAGVPTELIKVLGGWKSDCYLQYLHFPVEARTAATELMTLRIQAVGW